MRQFVYSAIFYYDNANNNFIVAFPDINIFAEGENMEIAYKNAQDILLSYIKFCKQLEEFPSFPTPYNEIVNAYPNDKIMLVSVFLGDSESPDLSKNTNADMFD